MPDNEFPFIEDQPTEYSDFYQKFWDIAPAWRQGQRIKKAYTTDYTQTPLHTQIWRHLPVNPYYWKTPQEKAMAVHEDRLAKYFRNLGVNPKAALEAERERAKTTLAAKETAIDVRDPSKQYLPYPEIPAPVAKYQALDAQTQFLVDWVMFPYATTKMSFPLLGMAKKVLPSSIMKEVELGVKGKGMIPEESPVQFFKHMYPDLATFTTKSEFEQTAQRMANKLLQEIASAPSPEYGTTVAALRNLFQEPLEASLEQTARKAALEFIAENPTAFAEESVASIMQPPRYAQTLEVGEGLWSPTQVRPQRETFIGETYEPRAPMTVVPPQPKLTMDDILDNGYLIRGRTGHGGNIEGLAPWSGKGTFYTDTVAEAKEYATAFGQLRATPSDYLYYARPKKIKYYDTFEEAMAATNKFHAEGDLAFENAMAKLARAEKVDAIAYPSSLGSDAMEYFVLGVKPRLTYEQVAQKVYAAKPSLKPVGYKAPKKVRVTTPKPEVEAKPIVEAEQVFTKNEVKQMASDIASSQKSTGNAVFKPAQVEDMVGTEGFGVFIDRPSMIAIQGKEIPNATIEGFMRGHTKELAKPENVLRTWYNEDTGYSLVGMAKTYKTQSQAVRAAIDAGERTFIDFTTGETRAIPSVRDVVQKITAKAKESRAAWRATKKARREELAGRATVSKKLVQKYEREGLQTGEAIRKARGGLAGKEPTEISPIEASLSDVEKDVLEYTSQKVWSKDFFKVSDMQRIINKLYDNDLLTIHELNLFEKTFGSDITRLVVSAQASYWQRVWDMTTNVLNLPKAIKASFDTSFPLRQGSILGISHPKMATKAYKESLRALASEESYVDIHRFIMNDALFELEEKAGVWYAPLLRVSAKTEAKIGTESLEQVARGLGQRAEEFMTAWADRIPGVMHSERAFLTNGNLLRKYTFDHYAKQWLAAGKTWEKNAAEFADLARFVNYATGRGTLGKWESIGQHLNLAFFSPRYQASRFQLLWMLMSSQPAVKKIVAKHLATWFGTGLSVASLAYLAGARVETATNSSDFGKVVIGDAHIDIWGGYQQYARYISQMVTGQKKRSTGRINPKDRMETAQQLIRSKMSPALGNLWDIFAGVTPEGEELTFDLVWSKDKGILGQLYDGFMPLAEQDMVDALETNGIAANDWLAATGFIGFGFQSYDTSMQVVYDLYTLSSQMGNSYTEMNRFVLDGDQKGLDQYLDSHKNLPQNPLEMDAWNTARLILSRAQREISDLEHQIQQAKNNDSLTKYQQEAQVIALEAKKEAVAVNALLKYEYHMARYDQLQGRGSGPLLPEPPDDPLATSLSDDKVNELLGIK